jgi:hypothetical protein
MRWRDLLFMGIVAALTLAFIAVTVATWPSLLSQQRPIVGQSG